VGRMQEDLSEGEKQHSGRRFSKKVALVDPGGKHFAIRGRKCGAIGIGKGKTAGKVLGNGKGDASGKKRACNQTNRNSPWGGIKKTVKKGDAGKRGGVEGGLRGEDMEKK